MAETSFALGLRQSLASLFRNTSRQSEWGAALKDLISVFLTDGPSHTVFEEVCRASTSLSNVDSFVEALGVLLEFDFGEEALFLRVLQDLTDALQRCSRVDHVDAILRLMRRIMDQVSAAREFVLQEASRRWDQIRRAAREKEVDLYAACRMLEIFASTARSQLALSISFSYRSLADILPSLITHASEHVATAALSFARVLLQNQFITVEDDEAELRAPAAADSSNSTSGMSEGRLAFLCEYLAAASFEPPEWIVAQLHQTPPHPALTTRSLLHCIVTCIGDEPEGVAALLKYAAAAPVGSIDENLVEALEQAGRMRADDAVDIVRQFLVYLVQLHELPAKTVARIGQAIMELLPQCSTWDPIADDVLAALANLAKAPPAAVSVLVRVLAEVDGAALEPGLVERIVHWAQGVFAAATKSTRPVNRYLHVVSAAKALGAALTASTAIPVLPLAQEVAALLPDATDAAVREEIAAVAIALCAAHVERDAETTRLHSGVLAILGQMLDAAVADPVEAVRAAVLEALHRHPALDGHLVLSDPLECLFMAVHDDALRCGLLALEVCCRIAPRNPSIIGPGLVRIEARLVRDAQGKLLGLRDDAVQKLLVMAHADRLTTSQFVLETLCVDRLMHPASSLSLQCNFFAFLAAIAERAKRTDRHVDPDVLVKVAINAVQSPRFAPRRRAAAHTLAAVLRYGNKPMDPALFRQVTDVMLAARADVDLVAALAHVVGVIGGVHSARTLLFDTALANRDASSADANAAELEALKPPPRSHPKLQLQNASVALYTLAKCLRGDVHQQRGLIQCMGELIDVIGPQQRQQLAPHLVPCMLGWLSDPGRTHLHSHLLGHLRTLWEQRDGISKPLRSAMLSVLENYSRTMDRSNSHIAENYVALLVQIARGAPDEIRGQQWIPVVAQQRLIENRDNRLALLCIELLEAIVFALDKELHHILSQVLSCVRSTNADVQLRSVSFLASIVHFQAVKDCCARVVHAVLGMVTAPQTQPTVQSRGIEFLCVLLSTLGNSAARFVRVVHAALQKAGIEHEQFERSIVHFNASGSFPDIEDRREPIPPASASNASDAMFVVTSRAELSNQQVKLCLADTLSIPPNAVNVVSNVSNGGTTIIKFRFENVTIDVTHNFINLVNHDDTSLRRLEIVNVTTERVSAGEPTARDFLRALNKLRAWRRLARNASTHEWNSWLTSAALELVHCSEPALRTLSEVVKSNEMLAREIFPFAFVWVFSKQDLERKREMVSTLSAAIESSSPEVRQILFSLAEFMESERSEQVVTKAITQTQRCVVARPSLDEKFGIHYEGEGNNIIVVKVAEGGPGHRARVPVGYTLKRIDGVEITAVSQIVSHIKNKLETVLDLAKEDQRRIVSSKHRPFFDLEKLANVAHNSHLFAKALHYYELVFEESAMALPDPEARKTMLTAATALSNIYNVTGNTHEFSGLHRCTVNLVGDDNALAVSAKTFNNKTDVAAGTIRQAEAQGKFEEIVNGYMFVKSSDPKALKHRSAFTNELCVAAANSALALGMWDVLNECVGHIRPGPERAFMQCVASVARKDHIDDTTALVRTCRRALALKFTSEIGESYSTAYDSLLQLQHLSHLKEISIYRTAAESVRQRLHELWSRRLASMTRSAQHWTVSMALNRLVIAPEDDLDARLTYASICREVGWHSRAERVLAELLGVEALNQNEGKLYTEMTRPRVALALFKEKYYAKAQTEAIAEFEDYMRLAQDRFGTDPSWARCHLQLGEWFMNANQPERALQQVRRATEVDSSNIAAWHAWGMLAYRQAHAAMASDSEHSVELIVSSLEGLARAVELGEDRLGTQDVLRIISVWMTYGHIPRVLRAVLVSIERCHVTAWLRVVPQLIARLGSCHRDVRHSVVSLVRSIAECYPHALIYPLTVSEKSGGKDSQRRVAAGEILLAIREAHPQLVDHASLISDELVRIAILWAEKWTESLTRASRLQERQDCRVVLEHLQPLYDELESPMTGDEKLFESHYGQTLRRAKSALLTDPTAGQAWNFFQQVYQKISRPARHLLLSSVSPKLADLKNSVVPVPGLSSQGTTVTISQFVNDITVIPSKHKPRRFALRGSDGVEYRFLLKGHEDLRQDERVMQLFDLLNTLFRTDPAANALGLRVVRYTAVPLSDNVGILTWLDNSETLFKLIEARRNATGIPMHEECNLIVKKGRLNRIEEYQTLPKVVRRDLLQFAIDATPSDEMRRIQWDANDTCEAWLSYRAVYGRTLAVMSMVGHLLGLGDRHLNNLMIQKDGAIVHIDFGDCFEVAMTRDQFPERVPFRLTRLLVRALGVMEVEGTFRLTSELVVKQLRKFRDSLLSVLETFIDDPLVSWRSRRRHADGKTGDRPSGTATGGTGSSTGGEGGGKVEWSRCVDRIVEAVSDSADDQRITAAVTQAAAASSSKCKELALQAHDMALTTARANVVHKLTTAGVEAAIEEFVAYLPVLANDVRISTDGVHLAPKVDIENFFAHTQEAPHRDFGDRALNRIKCKLSGTDFTAESLPYASSHNLLADDKTSPSRRSPDRPRASDSNAMFSVLPDFFIKDSVFGDSVANDDGKQMDDGEDSVTSDANLSDGLSVVAQVDRLIREARGMENLADAYLTGWAPFL